MKTPNPTQPAASFRFRRFPKAGERDSVTGLSLSTLALWRKRGFIATAVVRDPGTKRGLVFLDGDSVDAFLASRIAAPGEVAADTSPAVTRRKELAARRCSRRPAPSPTPADVGNN